MLSEAGKHYGEGIIKEYSKRLTLDLGKGYDISNLKRMRQFYYMIEKGVALPHLLSWSHILAILLLENIHAINYYINICVIQNLSYRALREKIKSKEYERLPEETKLKIITEAGSKYGGKILKEYSNKLIVEFEKNIMREY